MDPRHKDLLEWDLVKLTGGYPKYDYAALKEFSEDGLLVIKAKYPKSRRHWLVIPYDNVDWVHDLTREHVPLLRKMQLAAEMLLWRKSEPREDYLFGFHVIPVQRRLHLHVIHRDFDFAEKAFLKDWRKYNTFTTPFFIVLGPLIQQLEAVGVGHLPSMEAAYEMLERENKYHPRRQVLGAPVLLRLLTVECLRHGTKYPPCTRAKMPCSCL